MKKLSFLLIALLMAIMANAQMDSNNEIYFHQIQM
jgi:hypothetical protein